MAARPAPNPIALFVIATLIWGSTWFAIRYQLGVVAPEVSVAYRFAVAGALLLGGCLAKGYSLRFDARTHGYLVLQGALLFGLNYVAVYIAEQDVASGLVAVLFSTIVFMNPIGMRIVYGVRVTLWTLAGAMLGVAGVALLFLPELTVASHGGESARGMLYALGGTVLASAGNLVAVRNQKAGVPTFPGLAWSMPYGALVAAATVVAQGTAWTFDSRPAYLASFVYLVVAGSIAAFGAYLTLLRRIGAGPASFVSVATPVVALALSTAFEGYRWTLAATLGAVLAIGGNVLALRLGAGRPR